MNIPSNFEQCFDYFDKKACQKLKIQILQIYNSQVLHQIKMVLLKNILYRGHLKKIWVSLLIKQKITLLLWVEIHIFLCLTI